MLKGTAALALFALGPAKPGRASPPTSASPSRTPGPAAPSSGAVTSAVPASPAPGRLVGYVFNAKTRDVTLFDPATRRVLATKPLGAVVRWLSNEQRL